MTDAERERILDARIQRRLATDRAYRNAANAEEQAQREEEIEREEEARLDTRWAVVRARTQRELEAYLPDNYRVAFAATPTPDGRQDFVIEGRDVAGWTLDGYVLPRLASGLLFGRELPSRDAAYEAASAAMN